MKLILVQQANSVKDLYINPEHIIAIENIFRVGQSGEEVFFVKLTHHVNYGYFLNEKNGLRLINSCTLIANHKDK